VNLTEPLPTTDPTPADNRRVVLWAIIVLPLASAVCSLAVLVTFLVWLL
jgi:hypothetical protein